MKNSTSLYYLERLTKIIQPGWLSLDHTPRHEALRTMTYLLTPALPRKDKALMIKQSKSGKKADKKKGGQEKN